MNNTVYSFKCGLFSLSFNEPYDKENDELSSESDLLLLFFDWVSSN
jgi:hypothetical protein